MPPPVTSSSGLFHSAADLQLARTNHEREPIAGALARLEQPEADTLAQAQLTALRGQYLQDARAGDIAAALVNTSEFASDSGTELADIKRFLGWLSVLAMLRDHASWPPTWLANIESRLARLAKSSATGDTEYELWLAAVIMASGIILGSEENVERGAAVYRRSVNERIHPEGYLKGIADIGDLTARYEAQLSAACALVLLAEMAGRVGLDLWSYESRAVSVITAVTYTHYYYFFPEKWRWETGLTRERTLAAVRHEGAFMEMVGRRAPLHGIEELFAEQRPLYSAHGGGLTTLTHGMKPEQKRRWRLW